MITNLLFFLLLSQFTVPMHTGATAKTGGGGGGAITRGAVASGTGSAGTGTTNSLNVAAGDHLIAWCKTGGANNTISMTDTIGNTFNKGTHQNDASFGNTELFYAISSGSNAADIFTCTNSNAANFITIVALQYQGGASSAINDVLMNSAGSGGNWTTAAFSTANVNEVVVQCFVAVAGAAGTIGSVAGTLRYNSGGTNPTLCQDAIFTSIQTSITAQLLIPGTGSYNGQMGAFK
jgi:hypothetical protein